MSVIWSHKLNQATLYSSSRHEVVDDVSGKVENVSPSGYVGGICVVCAVRRNAKIWPIEGSFISLTDVAYI